MDIMMLVSEGSIATPSQTSEELSPTSSEQGHFSRSLHEHLLNSGLAPIYLPTPAHTPQTPQEYWPSRVHDQRMEPQIHPQPCEGQSTSIDIIPKSFPCITCGKGFARRSDLARHERIHSGIRPHVCEYPGCGKKFIQKSALTVHTRVHTGEKPHMCERCSKPFSDSSSLARHRRIHSGKRPYQCPYADCQKTFTRRTTLTRHQNHHSGTIEEAAAATTAALAARQSSNQNGPPLRSYGSSPSSNDSTPRLDKRSLFDSRITHSNQSSTMAHDASSYRRTSEQMSSQINNYFL